MVLVVNVYVEFVKLMMIDLINSEAAALVNAQ